MNDWMGFDSGIPSRRAFSLWVVLGCAAGVVLVVAWFFGKWLIGGGA